MPRLTVAEAAYSLPETVLNVALIGGAIAGKAATIAIAISIATSAYSIAVAPLLFFEKQRARRRKRSAARVFCIALMVPFAR